MDTDVAVRVPIEIDDISPTLPPSTQADDNTLKEQTYLEQARVDSFRQNTRHRAEYASKIFWLVVGWFVGIFILLFLQGYHIFSFNLSDSVLIAVISGLSVTVLGVFVIVAKYLFSHERDALS